MPTYTVSGGKYTVNAGALPQYIIRTGLVSVSDITPVSLADSAAANGTIYYSTTQSKLVYKDSVGVVHALY